MEEVEIVYKDKIFKGNLINKTEEILTLKLISGYNANFKSSNISQIKRIENNGDNKKKNIREKSEINTKISNKLPKITIIHTGGTIASKVDYRTGAVSSKFTAEELLSLFPDLNEIANITPVMAFNLFSEDIRFSEYNVLLKEIDFAIKNGSEGVIISHGTDTMHYTSSALEYFTKNLPIPVILVGAQRSSDRASSDAFSNLKSAIEFITLCPNFKRVGICMHETISDDSFLILDGISVKKLHSTRRDAFKQVNYHPFARIKFGKVEILRKELIYENSIGVFSYTKIKEDLKIGFCKAHPNMFSFEIENLKNYDIVILEGTGVGNFPENNSNVELDGDILKAISNLSKKVKLIGSVQTVFGEVSLDIYSRGRDLQDCGILGNRMNLCSETLMMRACFCFSQREMSFEEAWNQDLEKFKIRDIYL